MRPERRATRLAKEESRDTDVLGLVGQLGPSLSCLTSDMEETVRSVLRMISEILPVDHAVLMRAEGHSTSIGIDRAPTPTKQGIVGEALRTGRAVFSRDVGRDPRFIPGDLLVPGREVRSVLCHPLASGGEPLGILYLATRTDGAPLGEGDARLTAAISGLLSDILLRARHWAQMQRLVMIDPLTGLLNRSQMDVILETEAERSRRYGFPLCLVMMDLDHFKRVNDTRGHAVGDGVLRAFAELLRQGTRRVDHLFRYGGEEFLAVLPHIPKENAKIYGERIRRTTAERLHTDAGLRDPCTVSAGIATYPEDGDTVRAVLEAADSALYRAKNEGRDRVVLC